MVLQKRENLNDLDVDWLYSINIKYAGFGHGSISSEKPTCLHERRHWLVRIMDIYGTQFSIFIYFAYDNHWAGLGSRVDVIDGIMNDGHTAAIKYLTGYVIENH